MYARRMKRNAVEITWIVQGTCMSLQDRLIEAVVAGCHVLLHTMLQESMLTLLLRRLLHFHLPVICDQEIVRDA